MEFKSIGNTLKEKYPHLDTTKNPWKELEQSYTECGYGWHDLIIELMHKIEELYKVNDVSMDDFKINQIKEKYGGLRVYLSITYINSLQTLVNDLIEEYEKRAEMICEECSAPGVLYMNKGKWLQTLCHSCAEESEYSPVKA